jgi:hypothetical protein
VAERGRVAGGDAGHELEFRTGPLPARVQSRHMGIHPERLRTQETGLANRVGGGPVFVSQAYALRVGR